MAHALGAVNIILMVVIVTSFRLGVWFGQNWSQKFSPCTDLTDDGFVVDDGSDRVDDISRLRHHHKRIKIHDPKPISKPTADSAQSPSPVTTVMRKNARVVFHRNTLVGKFSKKRSDSIKIEDDVLIQKLNIIPNKLPLDSAVQLKQSVPDYVQIRESDSPGIGDFNCGGTVVEGSCAFYVNGIEHAKKICNSFSDYCRGFVFVSADSLPILLDSTTGQHLIYLKTKVNEMTMHFLTDFFVKSKHMKDVGWKFQ